MTEESNPKPGLLAETPDFSLVLGGPLFQLLCRAHLSGSAMELWQRRILVISLAAWLPLLLLTLLSGRAFGGPGIPFALDLGAHARFLLCVPLFVVAEVVVHGRIRLVVRQFLERGVVTPEEQPRFEQVIASGMRLRNSALAEVLLLALASFGGFWIGRRYIETQVATWYATTIGGRMQLSAAGYWYFFVSLTIFRFLLLRWYFRLFVWYRFLWQVSRRIRLRLNALHPDRAGGLGFLADSVFALSPLLLAHTIGLAGIIGGKIWHEGATLPQFKLEIAAWMVFLILLALAPLCFFVSRLAEARRTGLHEYGIVGSRYVAEFRSKWIEGKAAEGEALVGSGDIQSLADLSNSFEVVHEMGIVPVSRGTVVRLVILIALPLLPLMLTMVPLERLIDHALGVFF